MAVMFWGKIGCYTDYFCHCLEGYACCERALLCVAAISEVNGMLGKNMAKFCSGDYNPEVVPAETRHLDPLLSTASRSPPAQIPVKGLDGNFMSDFYFSA